MTKEEQWRKELKRLGAVNVRARLNSGAFGRGDGAEVAFVAAEEYVEGGKKTHYPDRGFVEEWLADEEFAATKRSELQHRLLWVATIASVAAAGLALWTVLRG